MLGRRPVAILCAALLVSALSIATTPASPASAAQANSNSWAAFKLLNGHRAASHVHQLKMHPRIVDVAQAWANHLAAVDKLGHNPNFASQIGAAVGGHWSVVGENVGQGPSVSSIDAAFIRSLRHRANVLNDTFNYVGIGAARSHSGNLYIVVDFAAATGSQPTVRPGLAVAAATSLVSAAYQDFFGRGPTRSELAYWVGRLSNGTASVPQLMHALATSESWAGQLINTYYRDALGRAPDKAGFTYWVDQINKGRSPANIAAQFYGSDEHFRRNGGTMQGWLESLYQQLLGRSVDASGLSYWTALHQRGLSRRDIAFRIFQSNESLVDRVNLLYSELLGRPPDSSGLAHWVAVLGRTGNDVDLAVDLSSSGEYLRRAQRHFPAIT